MQVSDIISGMQERIPVNRLYNGSTQCSNDASSQLTTLPHLDHYLSDSISSPHKSFVISFYVPHLPLAVGKLSRSSSKNSSHSKYCVESLYILQEWRNRLERTIRSRLLRPTLTILLFITPHYRNNILNLNQSSNRSLRLLARRLRLRRQRVVHPNLIPNRITLIPRQIQSSLTSISSRLRRESS